MSLNKLKQSTLIYVNDGKEFPLFVTDYVRAKTKDLKEFGYNSLTEKEVLTAVYDILVKKETDKSIIHGFIKDEIKLI